MMKPQKSIQPAKGKLGVLIVGINGAVATTFIAGVLSVRKGLAKPIGSLAQMGTIRLGKRTEHRSPMIKDFVPLADMDDLVFGGWDIHNKNCYASAIEANVLEQTHLDKVKSELGALHPMRGVFDQYYVKRLTGSYVKKAANKSEQAEALREDIRNFKKKKKLDRLVMIWCGSTDLYFAAQRAPWSSAV